LSLKCHSTHVHWRNEIYVTCSGMIVTVIRQSCKREDLRRITDVIHVRLLWLLGNHSSDVSAVFINDHWTHVIITNSHNSKSLWTKLKCLLPSVQPIIFITQLISTVHRSILQSGKYQKIHCSLLNTDVTSQNSRSSAPRLRTCDHTRNYSDYIITTETVHILSDPTWLLKELHSVMAPVITSLCNASIAQSRFPASHKCAVLHPLLKKPHLDVATLILSHLQSQLSLQDFRRCYRFEIYPAVNTFDLLLSFQSAYHKCHSTETALVKIHNDIISAIDHGNLGALVTLDFSSAFDTVDHRTFLSILQQRFGVTDSALNWFNSYLSQNYRLVYPTQLQFTVVFLKIPLSATYSEFQPSLFCWRHLTDLCWRPTVTGWNHSIANIVLSGRCR